MIAPVQEKAPTGTGGTPAAIQGLSGTNAATSYRVAGHGASTGSAYSWAPVGRVATREGYPPGSMRLTCVEAMALRLDQVTRTRPGSLAARTSRGGERSTITEEASVHGPQTPPAPARIR